MVDGEEKKGAYSECCCTEKKEEKKVVCVHLFAFSVCLVFWICLAVLYSPGGSCFFMFVSMVA